LFQRLKPSLLKYSRTSVLSSTVEYKLVLVLIVDEDGTVNAPIEEVDKARMANDTDVFMIDVLI